ncbi:hypothetical protein [Halococcus salifodinae]|uniref:hypothetical protein n=1 Tax=Halococcus salifodinae TaxID=36738 RepID=UPI001267D148|nr:hypothetical protein [Halococcus salifodinae]
MSELHEAGELDELREYLEEEYETAYEELVTTLREDYLGFWDEENDEFTGPVSTNAIEGGNWRLKYGLGVPYGRCRSARARTTLPALHDSVSTFTNGSPAESFESVLGSASAADLRDSVGGVTRSVAA